MKLFETKPTVLPDWMAPTFAWVITFVVIGAAITQPDGVYVNRNMLWFPPLLAVAWTAGVISMARFKKKFREEHERLGSPQLFGSPYQGRHWRFLAYLFSFRFLALGDTVVSAGFSVFVGFTLLGLFGFFSLLGAQ